MTHPIGYYTNCAQAQKLVEKFGEGSHSVLPALSERDRAALIAISAMYFYRLRTGFPVDDTENVSLSELYMTLLEVEGGYATKSMKEAIDILMGIEAKDAINILAFLVQS